MTTVMGQRALAASDDVPAVESDLLWAGRRGDSAALARLFAPHERPLYALCRGMLGHSDDAEDAVQETFLRALRGLHGYRGETTLKAWLSRIAVNVCLKAIGSRKPVSNWGDAPPDVPSSQPSPEVAVLRQINLSAALAVLAPHQRTVLVLKEHEGWNAGEIAEAMGWNEKRVHNELYKARKTLADWRRETGEGTDQ